jgi:hypothetical protein
MANLSAKRILTDIAGYGCIIAAPLIGWLPGPGGIPLLITGLGLLSIHNPWAKQLLHFVRKRSESLSDLIFPNNQLVQWAWDIFVILLIIGGTYINVYVDSKYWQAASIVLFAMSTTLFLLNRRRLQWLDVKLRKRKQ